MNVDVENDHVLLEQGWAERPVDGDNIGKNYEPPYMSLVDKWYAIGIDHKERRMSAAMMFRTIRAMLPRNYDFPSERHLKNRIGARTDAINRMKKKKEKQESNTNATNSRAARNVDNKGDGKADRERLNPAEDPVTHDDNRNERDEVKGAGTDETVGAQRGGGTTYGAAESSGYIIPPGLERNGRSGRIDDPECGSELNRNRVNVAGASRGIDNATTETGGRSTSISQGVAMNETYATEILSVLGENPEIKRAAVYKKVLQKLGFDENSIPENFPSARQVANKVSNFRRASRGDDARRPSKRARKE